MARESVRADDGTAKPDGAAALVVDAPMAVSGTLDDAPKPPTLEELRALARKVAPNVKVVVVAATGSGGHVLAEMPGRRIAHAVHDGCTAEEAEAAVLRSVIAHHGGTLEV